MQVDDRSMPNTIGARRRMMAGIALLLLALSAIGGLFLWPAGRAPVALKSIGGALSPVLAIDDAGRTLAVLRSAIAKPSRAQMFALGAFGPDDYRLGVALLPASGPRADGARHAREREAARMHPAASGQLTRRTPTGPPAGLSFAI